MKQTVPIKGMHCASCTVRVRDELLQIDGVRSAEVSLRHDQAIIESSKEVKTYDIDVAVRRAGYTVGDEDRPFISKNPRDYRIVFFGIILTVMLFFIISKLDIGPSLFGHIKDNSFLYAIIMGITAGFSTCMALVGGLVIGLTARHEERHPKASKWQNFRPNIFFNIGRIAGFTVLGGVLGWVGSALTFTPFATGILTVLAGVFMLIIGLQLTGLFPRLTSFTLPPSLSKKFGLVKDRDKEYSHRGALLLGAVSFFLPCGFTQAMQLFAVSTGSAITGALVMGLFAIGTAPGLLVMGGAASLVNGEKGKTAMKLVGVLVAGLALLNIQAGFSLTGLRLPEIKAPSLGSTLEVPPENDITLIFHDAYRQFDKKDVTLRANQPYRITIKPEKDGLGCMGTVTIRGLSQYKPRLLKANQSLVFEFKTTTNGDYTFVCAMGVPFDTTVKVETS